MEPIFQLVGSLVASRPAAEAIDAFVQAARRERAAVMAKSAQGATLVRFNATDLRLVALACRMLRDSPGLPLRFAFAVGQKDPAAGSDGMDLGTRGLEQAQSLAAAAPDGQVLVAPQLTGPLVEAGFKLLSRQLRRRGAAPVAAFLVDLGARARDDGAPDSVPASTFGDEPAELEPTELALRTLTTQLDEMARRQVDLEWRQQQLLGRLGRVDTARVPGRSWDRLLEDLDLQMGRIEARLGVIDGSERRLETLQVSLQGLEKALAEQLPRLGEIDALRRQCDAVVAELAEAQRTLAAVAAQQQPLQQQLPTMATQLAQHEQRLAALDRDSEAVDHRLRDIAGRDAALQAVQAEMAAVEAAGQRCRADLQFLTEHRGEVDALRAKLDDLLGRAADTDRKIDDVEARRQGVEEVQSRAASVTHMLGDIQLHLERLSEQRAVIDQVGDRLARLDFTMQEAQGTLHALQREREVAERIEQSLKALRARTAVKPPV